MDMKKGKKKIGYLESLIKSNTGNSSKSFALVLSAIIGGLLGLVIGFILIYDVIKDGTVDTNLEQLAWFLVSAGAYMFGGGFNKVLAERYEDKVRNHKEYSENESSEEYNDDDKCECYDED